MSRIRDIANILTASTSMATDAEVTSAISAATSGLATSSSVSSAVSTHATAANGHVGRGTTANRPVSPTVGDVYFDTTLASLIAYKSTGWEKVSQDPAPQIASISPTTAATTGTTITITGSSFKSGLAVQFIGTNAAVYNSPVAVFVGAATATATTPALPTAYEPYDVKVVNADNQFAVLENCLDSGGTPIWNTASGTITTINEQSSLSTSVSATDPDGTSIVYSSSNLPAWVSLNSSTGALTGTSPDIASNTTYSFDVSASDGVNTSSRSFAVVVNYVLPVITSIGFGSSSRVSAFSSYTGQDGVTRSAGKCGPGTVGYHGVSLTRYFPADKDFELIIKVSQNSDGTSTGENNHYMGLGWVFGNGYSDSTANTLPFPDEWYGADTSPFNGITGTKYANYYNTDNGSDTPSTGYGFPLFFKFTRVGNEFNAYYGRSYTTANNQVGNISVPANVAGKDIILALGEASATEYFFIEKFTMST